MPYRFEVARHATIAYLEALYAAMIDTTHWTDANLIKQCIENAKTANDYPTLTNIIELAVERLRHFDDT